MRPATITAYQIDLWWCVRFWAATNCTISSPTDATRAHVSEDLGYLADQDSGDTAERGSWPEFGSSFASRR